MLRTIFAIINKFAFMTFITSGIIWLIRFNFSCFFLIPFSIGFVWFLTRILLLFANVTPSTIWGVDPEVKLTFPTVETKQSEYDGVLVARGWYQFVEVSVASKYADWVIHAVVSVAQIILFKFWFAAPSWIQ